jgi:uncharacterized Fe-S radical SAM superfamily protein PflX
MFEFNRTEVRRSSSVPLELAGEGRFVLSRNEFVPTYMKTYEEGRLREKVEEALELLRSCHVCPRDCQVNRLENKTGVCKSGRLARVTSAFTHFGEEDCLRGWNGSGTIFFAWCNLRCVFCQNFATSQQGDGTEVTASQLADINREIGESEFEQFVGRFGGVLPTLDKFWVIGSGEPGQVERRHSYSFGQFQQNLNLFLYYRNEGS